MILYLDTSALVKLYVDEPGSAGIREALVRAKAVYTHQITYFLPGPKSVFVLLFHWDDRCELLVFLNGQIYYDFLRWFFIAKPCKTYYENL
jgi:hypothetical protein